MMAENRSTFEVRCPACQAILVVDAETKEVLLHKEVKTSPVTDIAKAVQALKENVGQREEAFRKSLEAEKNKGSRLKKTFEEAMKRAKEEPDAPPPMREIDLD
ncbi:MAG: hypothetical protein HY548_04730 [Elusimicrobia bacterium]|nr:hypothetical protein [Elusimicrobiota bacterium]